MKTVAILTMLFLSLLTRISAAGDSRTVCSQYKCFQSEVMATPQGREKGLMYRESMPEDQGMLFIFDQPGEYVFWMKNMTFPIDIVWLDEEKRVVHTELDVPPCLKDPCPLYAPQAKALYVLEIAAGQIEAADIRQGEALIWN